MKLLGNYYGGIHTKTAGSGIQKRGSSFGRVRISGKAGEVVRLPLEGLAASVCQYQAILVQSFGTALTVAATLEDPDVACNPKNDTAIWGAGEAVPATDIKILTVPTATALKITFTAAGYAIVALT